MTSPLLSVRGVHTYYGNIIALRGVDIDLNDGEIVALIGANGAGKSTLFKTIVGFLEPRRGTLLFRGRRVARLAPARRIATTSACAVGSLVASTSLCPSPTIPPSLTITEPNGPPKPPSMPLRDSAMTRFMISV